MRRRIFGTRIAGAGFAVSTLVMVGCGSGDPVAVTESPGMAVESHSGGSNQPPVIRDLRLEPSQPSVDDTVRAVARVHDPEGDTTTLAYAWAVDGEEVGRGETLDLAGSVPGASVDVRVVASDGASEGPPASASAWIIDRAPVVRGIAVDPTAEVYPGDSIFVTPTGSDPDGGPVDFRFAWLVNGEVVDGDESAFSTEGLRQGDRVRARVVAWDGANESRAVETEDVRVGSAHPEIVSAPPGLTDAGLFRYQVEATDPDGDRNLRFRLDEAPEGMRIDAVLGTIEWRPGAKQVGVHPIAVVVRDSTRLETTQRFEVTVSDALPPAAPAPDATDPTGDES